MENQPREESMGQERMAEENTEALRHRAVTLEIETAGPADLLLAPRPIPFWGQRLAEVMIEGAAQAREIGALDSCCRAYLLRPAGEALRLRYAFDCAAPEAEGFAPPEAFWSVARNAMTTAAPALAAEARALTEGAADQREAIRRLIDHAATLFHYGHPEERFTDGQAAVPALCGLTRGSCLDINTYLLAAALSLGIRGQYVAGYWFHPERTTTPDFHCWLAFLPAGAAAPLFWDLAHAVKWAESLGARIGEGLNPAGGRRLAMSCGRGLRFATPWGETTVSHFAEPIRLTPEGGRRPVFRVSLEER